MEIGGCLVRIYLQKAGATIMKIVLTSAEFIYQALTSHARCL